ncbi:hypothetical protein, partial [uncultured Anaerococcus sp.]
MKNNKILAVALSAGLVLGGAYAVDNNVAYAAENDPSIRTDANDTPNVIEGIFDSEVDENGEGATTVEENLPEPSEGPEIIGEDGNPVPDRYGEEDSAERPTIPAGDVREDEADNLESAKSRAIAEIGNKANLTNEQRQKAIEDISK